MCIYALLKIFSPNHYRKMWGEDRSQSCIETFNGPRDLGQQPVTDSGIPSAAEEAEPGFCSLASDRSSLLPATRKDFVGFVGILGFLEFALKQSSKKCL